MIRTILFHFSLICCLLFTANNPLFSQDVAGIIEEVLQTKPREVLKYELKNRPNTLALETNFNNANLKNPADIARLKSKVILKVELIYTTYKKSEDFDQHTLNRKRLKSLFDASPDLKTQKGVEWILWAQTSCTSPEAGKDFFHGIVITYRESPSAIMERIEQNFIRSVADGTVPSYAYDQYVKNEFKKALADSATEPEEKKPVIKLPSFPGGERARIDYFTRNLKYPKGSGPDRVYVEFIIDKDGKIQHIQFPEQYASTPYREEVLRFLQANPDWSPGSIDGKKTDCMVQLSIDFMERGTVAASPLEIYAMDAPPDKKPKLPPYDYSKIKPPLNSKNVVETLAKFGWKNVSLVCDVTGSMAGYNAQILEFIKGQLASKSMQFTQITFFNDGDNRPTRTKKMGEVGGIYSISSTNYEAIVDVLIETMRKGSGGELEENDIEALIKAEQTCPDCTQHVLIADNFADPRDMKLLSQVKKPVHVIVCGGNAIMNELYLDIAYQTKGSVHFNTTDITDISNFEEGATVSIGKQTYVLQGGKFVRKRK